MKFIIKPFSEIMIKSKPVRKRYLSRLQSNIQVKTKEISTDLKVQVFWDKLEVNFPETVLLSTSKYQQLLKALKRMPGVESFLEVARFEYKDMYNTFEEVNNIYLERIKEKSFVVRVKRTGEHNFTSTELERYIGWGLLKKLDEEWIHGKVDLHQPEITVWVEIKHTNLYIIKEKFEGIWWYPTGVQDKIISLLSGWFDSGVSTYSMMKRGCKVDFLFFNLGGSAHELWVKQVAYYLNNQFSAGYKANIITVPFEEIVKDLVMNVDHKYRAIILKRCMLKVADMIAQSENYYAIVKGDSLGQVSSQTLKNMYTIDKASDTLVLRPLISFNKQEIINISKNIGTYDFAVNMPEYCGVISDRPATWAKLNDVLASEKTFRSELLQQAFEKRKVEKTSDVIEHAGNTHKEIETTHFPASGDIIIDLRENENREKKPLTLETNEIISIPFFDINNKFKDLDQTKKYLLFCDKWVLSKLHGLYLKEKWFENIKVYRALENDKTCGTL